MIEYLWVIEAIPGLYKRSKYEQIVCRFRWQIYERQDQSWILIKDLHINRLTADFSIRSMTKQISYEFLFRICVWALLIYILMDQKIVAQI